MTTKEIQLIQSLLNILETEVAKAVKLSDDPTRLGGYFCLARKDGTVLFITMGGKANPERKVRHLGLCQEKASRLAVNHASLGHVSSFQSRNPSEDKMGGAILTNDYILSFSGLPELLDEALVLNIAQNLPNFISKEIYERIILESKNPFVGDIIM